MSVASVLTRNDGNAPPANVRVRQWLSRAGLGEYRDAFARTAEREFTALGMVDFQNFGVVDVAHKQTLFRLIKNLQNAESDLQNDLQSDDAELPSRVKHMALVDVHAAEHDELLLSPLLRPNTRATRESEFGGRRRSRGTCSELRGLACSAARRKSPPRPPRHSLQPLQQQQKSPPPRASAPGPRRK